MGAISRHRGDQRVQLISLLLQLLHKRLDCALAKRFTLAALPGTKHYSIDSSLQNSTHMTDKHCVKLRSGFPHFTQYLLMNPHKIVNEIKDERN